MITWDIPFLKDRVPQGRGQAASALLVAANALYNADVPARYRRHLDAATVELLRRAVDLVDDYAAQRALRDGGRP